MSEKRIVVPEGMLNAAYNEQSLYGNLSKSIERALLWLSENPIVPAHEQYSAMMRDWKEGQGVEHFYGAVEWQRRMFLAPKTEVPEEVKDLLVEPVSENWNGSELNEAVIEAFNRGKKAGK